MEEIRRDGKPRIEINSKTLIEMDVPMAFKSFDNHAQELQRMVNNHPQEQIEKEELYKKSIIETKKNQRIKKEHKKKMIKRSLYAAALISVGALACKASQNHQGRNEIVREFQEATNSFGVVNWNNGYQINEGETLVDFEIGIDHMIQKAKEKGMNDQEIAIGLSSCINESTAKKAIGEENYPTFKERCELYEKAYHEKNLEKGNGK